MKWIGFTLGALCACFGFGARVAHADDGTWGALSTIEQGPLYAVDENPVIALEQELLVLEDHVDGSVSALFQFRNTSDQPVTVEAGFPIRFDFEVTRDHEKNGLSVGPNEGGRPVYSVVSTPKFEGVDRRLLELTGLKVRDWKPPEGDSDWNLYYIREADFVKRRLERKVPAKTPLRFSIEQDGKPVRLTSLVVELDPAARPPVVFHFRHQLHFAPKATSVVRVRYRSKTLSGTDYSEGGLTYVDEYTWRYVLRTGATWKGPLGKLVLAVPLGGHCDDEETWEHLGTWGGYRILTRPPFEPTAADDLRCRWKHEDHDDSSWSERWAEKKPWTEVRTSPAGVKGVSASSSVKFTADVYTDCCTVTEAPNTAEAAFDGIIETAWSEGAKKDVGE
jgi:hypothetical protein